MKTLLVLALVLVASAPIAEARQRGANNSGRAVTAGGHVVHSRRAPVILHRAVPPFRGVHVYGGR